MATIQGIYIALFGRPADPAGLAFFNEQTNNGADLTAIGDLAATDEYQDRFEGLNNVQIVTKIYQDLFGRDPDAAGLAFFVAALNAGTYDINNVAIAILDGARGDDADIVANKIISADRFTSAIDTDLEVASYVGKDAADLGRAYLAVVTADEATIRTQAQANAAVQGVVDSGLAGNTFSILAGSDVSTTLANGADENVTTNNNDNVTVDNNWTAATEINAGLGTDTVNITVAGGANTTIATSLVNVERLFVTAAGGAPAAFNIAATAGLQQVWANGSADALNDLTISGIKLGTTIGVNGAGANDSIFTFADSAGGDDSATLVVRSAVNTGVVSVDNIENLTINVDGVSSLNLDASQAETIVITGNGDLTLASSGLFAAESIDASAHVGKLIVTTGAVTGELTIVGGASNDVFNVTAGAEGVTLTGNGGSDLFNIGALSNINGADEAALTTSLTDDLIQITDFNASQDTVQIDLSGSETVLTNVQLSNIESATSLYAALQVVAGATADPGAVGNYAVFQYDGSTYVFQDNGDDVFGANDGLVELVGFTGNLTDLNFVGV